MSYQELQNHFEQIGHLEGACQVLHWDGAAMMPKGGAEARAGQVSTLTVMAHQQRTDPRVPEWIDSAQEAGRRGALTGWEQANVREINREYTHAVALPERLVRALSEAGSRCEMIWREARAGDDFDRLRTPLEEVVELVRESAEIKAERFGRSRYEVLLDAYEPGGSEAHIDTLFTELMTALPSLIEEAIEVQERRDRDAPLPSLEGPFSISAQRQLGVDLMRRLGFDFNHGRLDVSLHPFCGGTSSDVRITTRYDESDFTQSLMGVIHETGHALYEQGLPEAWRLQPVGRARGMSLHESQSLFMEMQIGRSEGFIRHIAPLVRDAFEGRGAGWSAEGLHRHYTRVSRSLIRVDADEITYPAHVILRYELEKSMLNGALEVRDLPGAWADGMERLVGVRPSNNRDGCMQDIHWMDGSFGYFPTYTLGAMTAAQLYAALDDSTPNLQEALSEGHLEGVVDWLRAQVHAQASRLSADELLTQATGRPLEVAPFVAHLRRRYIDIA